MGKNLQNLRLSQGLSRGALGDIIGVTQQSIEKYEKAYCRISLSTALSLAKALKVKLLDLVTGVDDVPDFTDLDSASLTLYKKITALNDDDKKHFVKMINSRLVYEKEKEQVE